MKKNCRAITLVEMLMVVAVIAILIALVFPVFGPVKAKSRETVCMSNLHQIGIALATYVSDYEGIDPVAGATQTTASLGLPFPPGPFFKQYVKNDDVRKCPSYHGGGEPLSGYMYPFFSSEDYPGAVSISGAMCPAVICDQHNARLDFSQAPHWETKKVLFLRLNQQVTSKTVPVRDYDYSRW